MQDVLLVPRNRLEAQRGQMYVQGISIKIGMAEIAPVLGEFVHGIAASNTDSQTEATSYLTTSRDRSNSVLPAAKHGIYAAGMLFRFS